MIWRVIAFWLAIVAVAATELPSSFVFSVCFCEVSFCCAGRSANGLKCAYDLCGNMLVGGKQSLVYNPENRLVASAVSNRVTTFGYADDGTRLWKQPPGTNGLQVWIGGIYEEKNGKTLFHISAGDRIVYTAFSSDGSAGEYYHPDHLHSAQVMSTNSGALTQHYEYTAYGNTRYTFSTNAFPLSRRYTSQVLDEDTGLYYYGSRYYDPVLGRFVQPDTIVPNRFDPQAYDRYAYARDNPLRYTDPSGHGPVDDALFNTGTIKSSYQLMTMHDTGWNKAWEIPAGVVGMAAGTADAAFNMMSLGGKGVVEGGIKETVKVGVEELGKVEGEKAGARAAERSLAKDVPNPFGRKGGLEHQARVNEVANDVKERGLDPRKEYQVETPGGAKESRFADVAGLDSKGNPVELHQVGRETKGGLPVARERQAIQDIKSATGQTPQFHPYNTTPPPPQP